MKTILLLMVLSLSTYARNMGSVSGSIYDEKGEKVGFVNVFLFHSADSVLYKAVSAGEDGKFAFEQVPDRSYFLKISGVGYEEFRTPTFVINSENPSVYFEKLVVKEAAQMLAAVQVKTRKPFIEQQVDKMVINVENSISGTGSTALEILEKAPGVVVDRQNDQIKIRNKAGVIVMIDGKISYLSAESLSQYLNNLTSEQIESIEVITNPSSRYDAAGNSGIINIRLKKNKAHGTNGTFSVSGGSALIPDSDSDMYRGNVNLNLNHRSKKWNLFTNVNGGRNRFYSDNTIQRVTRYEGVTTNFDQYAQRKGGGIFHSVRAGADYYLNDRTTLGIQGDLNGWNGKMNSDGKTRMKDSKGGEVTESYLLPFSDRKMQNDNFSGNFNVRHKLKGEGKEINFDLDYSGFRSDVHQEFSNEYYSYFTKPDSITKQIMDQPTNIDIYSAKLDFILPTASKVKYEWGLKTGFVDTDNDFKFKNWRGIKWEDDSQRTNHFVYKEWINAAYMNVGYQWTKWTVQGGLRLEHTQSDGKSITTGQQNKRNYLNLFPTVFVQQKVGENHSLKYSYSRRIDRPNYQQLNPFMFILDPYTYEVGNPFLQPQFTDSYELAYTLKDNYTVSLAYADTKQLIFEVLEQDDAAKTTYQTNRNLAGMQNYSMNISAPVQITKWWNTQNNASLFYSHFKGDNVSGASLDAGKVAYNLYTSHTFMLKKNWTVEANMWYNSPVQYGIIEITKPQYAVNGGIQKSFPKQNSKLKFSFSDAFLTSFFGGKISYSNMDMTLNNRWAARRVALTYTINFGNQNVKSSRRSTGNDDLKRRAGGNTE